MLNRQFWLIAVFSAAVLVGCGGGGDEPVSTSGSLAPSNSHVTISGRITFDFVPHNQFSSGLDYSNTQSLPVRGATVQLLDNTQEVLVTDTADSDGGYSFATTANNTVRIRVLAELAGFGSDWQV